MYEDLSSDSNVSIHSIVTDIDNFDSDNEAPEDKIGQIDKIIKNHVTKQIIKPGHGLIKASKNDLLTLTYKCFYPSNEIILDFYESNPITKYIYNFKLPKGIIEAIRNMRRGEKSRITLQPKYGFRKVNFENINKFMEIEHLKINLDEENFNKMKKTPIIYEIELIDLKQFYDISGNRKMLKFILNQGEGIVKPSEMNEVLFNFKLFVNDQILIEKIEEKLILEVSNFCQAEMIIIKSLKKKEKARIDIEHKYFEEIITNGYIGKNLDRNLIKDFSNSNSNKKRIIVEIELLKFKDNSKIIQHKNIDYRIKTLNKGLGYVCPWNNSFVFVSLIIKINNQILFSSLKSHIQIDNFILQIKQIKNKIKLIKSYEKKINNIIEECFTKGELGEIDGILIDPLLCEFPSIIIKEIIPKLKLLETIYVKFTSNLDYLKIKEKEIIKNDLSVANDYEIIITLISFRERITFLNKTLKNSEKFNQISDYKTKANFFFNNNILNKSRHINKFLVTEYIKYINLEKGMNKLTQNQKDFNELNLNDLDLEDDIEIHKEMRKVFSNLIKIYYKNKKYKKCNEIITKFFIIFDKEQKDENILYMRYKILIEGFHNLEEAKIIIEKILNLNNNSNNLNEYKKDLEIVENKILDGKKKKNMFVKKMFKFE